MSTQSKSGRRTVLQDNSWIRRNAEEDEPIDDDPNFGKVVLSQQKPVDDVSSKSVKAEKPPVNSGTSFNSFSKSPAPVNTSIAAIVPPPAPAPAPKPPVPAKNPVLKTPNTSSFTARVFSGANTSKVLSPVKPSFGEKSPELTASQTTNGLNKSISAGPPSSVTDVKSSSVSSPVKSSTRSESVSLSTLKSSTQSQSQSESVSVSTLKSSTPSQSQSESVSVSTVKSSTPSQSQSESVSVSTVKSSTPSQSQSESVSVSTLKSSTPFQSQSESVSVSTVKSSTPFQSQSESVSVSTVKSSTPFQSQGESVSVSTVKSSTPFQSQSESVSGSTLKSSTPFQSQSESVSVSTLKSSTPSQSQTTVTNTRTSSALDESLSSRYSPSAVSLNTHYGSQTPSAPLEDLADSSLSARARSQTQVRTVNTEIPAAPQTLRSPLQTLQSSSRVSSRDACTVCGKPIAGDGKMILQELNIISHTSCFRCAVCRCDLGGLEAGKSLWVLRERVHCSNCFSDIRGQWYI
ncbi:uncharacterized protein LOC143756695 isoform X2 [Siphateles boraxobius]|uniref:uncharacterized protein LOC143756695 isoform X2 n=1 Tax=Siphateles boraxobius TaxID=180520 RepID=UPI0040637B80